MYFFSFPFASLAVPAPTGAAVPGAPAAGQSAASSPAAVIPDISLSWSSYFEALAVLCFILALLWAVAWIFKQRGKGMFAASAPLMRIESRLALGPKKWLYSVRCMDKRLILGVCDRSITCLCEEPLSDEEMRPPAPRAFFRRAGAGPAREDASKDASGETFASFLEKNEKGPQ